MQLFIKIENGTNIKLDVENSDSIENIKEKIYDQEGIAIDNQRLMFIGKQLEDDRILADYNILNDSILYIILIFKTHK